MCMFALWQCSLYSISGPESKSNSMNTHARVRTTESRELPSTAMINHVDITVLVTSCCLCSVRCFVGVILSRPNVELICILSESFRFVFSAVQRRQFVWEIGEIFVIVRHGRLRYFARERRKETAVNCVLTGHSRRLIENVHLGKKSTRHRKRNSILTIKSQQ